MAKKVTKESDLSSEGKQPWKMKRQHKVLIGTLLVLSSIALLLAYISFFIYGQQDQSAANQLLTQKEPVQNWLGKYGAYLAEYTINNGFGAASFLFVKLFFLTGAYLVMDIPLRKLKKVYFWDLFALVNISILLGFIATVFPQLGLPQLGGTIGYEMTLFMQDYIGQSGTFLVLLFGIMIYLIYKIKVSPEAIKTFFERSKKEIEDEINITPTPSAADLYNLEEYAVKEEEETPKPTSQFEIDKESLKPTISNPSEINRTPFLKPTSFEATPEPIAEPEIITTADNAFVIEKAHEEDLVEENLASRLVADFGLFDPTLDLSNYKFPTLDLLKEYSSGGITINQEELEENKNRILETLRNYKIEIAQIKATVGPSVTLYEIVPEAGIRISKIKSLEDDIALSLAALGIRIIAPMPGKGTIGIEVPNKNPTTVSMKSVIGSAKFQEAEMELHIAL